MTIRQGQGSAPEAKWTAVDGRRIRYREDGRRSGPDTLLLAPPSGLEAYESAWPSIVETGRVVAVDLPGFGASERCQDLSTPRLMAGFVTKAIEAFRLRHPHLAAADILTASALFTALDYPGVVESLILSEGLISAERRSTREVEAPAFEQEQIVAWSEITTKLHQITTPALIVAGPGRGSAPITINLLCERLPRCRIALVDGGLFTDGEDVLACAKIFGAWIGGGYRSAR
jgi:hypothetical protein